MNTRLMMFFLSMLALCFLLSACDDSPKISIEEANKRIIATQEGSRLVNEGMDLLEITPSDIWDSTKHQLFKNVGGSSWETYIVTNQKAIHIGNGFGGFGVTSAVPYDVNKDGTMDIVYAYSFGSGIHRSVISWFDIKNSTEHVVADMPETTEFRMYDLILKNESNEIIVYRINGMDNREINIDCLRTYPTKDEIDDMILDKVGILIWENSQLYNKLQN